ncbi:MAG: L-rhamnose mutarotase [Chloroflexi bacterium]|nr:L-rhamnose mutarotase [Chloroflexota bacterium]|tara:strand:+ start:2459 stop:2782 length:324 start_codon:yes stop_codon:yes gene_type:complete
MKRVAFQMKVKKDHLEEYVEWHKKVWPEMLEAIKRNGWNNYSLFMREDGLIFGYVEVPDSFSSALERMSREEINDKWQDFMAPYFEIPEGTHPDGNMIQLKEIFHTN